MFYQNTGAAESDQTSLRVDITADGEAKETQVAASDALGLALAGRPGCAHVAVEAFIIHFDAQSVADVVTDDRCATLLFHSIGPIQCAIGAQGFPTDELAETGTRVFKCAWKRKLTGGCPGCDQCANVAAARF